MLQVLIKAASPTDGQTWIPPLTSVMFSLGVIPPILWLYLSILSGGKLLRMRHYAGVLGHFKRKPCPSESSIARNTAFTGNVVSLMLQNFTIQYNMVVSLGFE